MTRSTGSLSENCRVVAVGGGHGLGRVLASLSMLKENLTGIVATTDDGGSTGRLRRASGCIAWGDTRNCLNQLCADNPTLPRTLFEYRYRDAGEMTGHNLGNMILLALDQMCVRPLDAVNLIRELLKVPSKILPMSEQPASLVAYVESQQIVGETTIDQLTVRPDSLTLIPDIQPPAEAIEALENADIIILGPGSFMTSILPPLLMKEVARAIYQSSAMKVYIGNVKPEPSAINTLSIPCILDWLKEMTGIYPDVLLWPTERPTPKGIRCILHQTALADNLIDGTHNKQALFDAINALWHKA
ncbi:putative gluconeogenesis factor [invertebrate metagenome]|uniref:Putative gluconeogenesis factor n=1 Tax=invertebrate metagenome TaxID=1711999 RepID=A0A2H9TCK6_9ZZZZ